MSVAPLRDDEAGALAALEALAVMDTAPEPAFDALVRAASLLCGVPMSFISLIDANRQWFKANVGLPGVNETPREVAFCAHALHDDSIFEIVDATKDARFADNPLVTGDPSIRFYAGMPLTLSDGHRIGTLCVIDRKPHQLSEQQRDILRSLGDAAAYALEGRRALNTVKAAEVALELERKRLAHIIEANEIGTWEINTQSHEARFNQRWAQMLGTTTEALGSATLETWLSTIHPDDITRATSAMQRLASGHLKKLELEMRVRHLNGGWVWVIDRGRVMTRNSDGSPQWLVGARVDITLRKHREEAMRRSEVFLDRTGKLAGVGGWEIDLVGRHIFYSEETYRLHALEPGAAVDLGAAIDFYTPAARSVLRAAIDLCVARGVGWDLELPFVRANGEHIWVRTVGTAEFAEGKAVRLVGALQDVTERVREHLALKDANERIAIATDSGGIGIWEFDLASRTAKWDPWVYRLYGLPDNGPEVTYEQWAAMLMPESLPRIQKAVADAVVGKAPFDLEYAVRWPDGSVHYLRGSARVTRDEKGRGIGLVGANWDVTETRRVAGILRKQSLVATIQAGVGLAANESTSLREALQICVDLICMHTGWSVGHVYLPSSDQIGLLIPADIWNQGATQKYPAFAEETSRTSVPTDSGLAGLLKRDRRPIAVHDLSTPQFARRASAIAEGFRWGLAAPVLVGDEVVAIIEFFSTESELLDPALIELVAYAGIQLGRVVDRERAHLTLKQQAVTLRQQSIIDELTGLYNRRGFHELAQERIKAASLTSQRAFLVFADLDGMKRINDELGHEAGDSALVAASMVLRKTLRASDVVARLGGDEFVALTCETGTFDSPALLERLESEVASLNAESALPFQLAVSFGISGPAADGESIHELLKRADEAMYEMKQARKKAQR